MAPRDLDIACCLESDSRQADSRGVLRARKIVALCKDSMVAAAAPSRLSGDSGAPVDNMERRRLATKAVETQGNRSVSPSAARGPPSQCSPSRCPALPGDTRPAVSRLCHEWWRVPMCLLVSTVSGPSCLLLYLRSVLLGRLSLLSHRALCPTLHCYPLAPN